MSTEKTISKNFKDDEIICRLPNGDLYLKPGVKRTKNYSLLDTGMQEEGINYIDLAKSRQVSRHLKHGFKDDSSDQYTDNWEDIRDNI